MISQAHACSEFLLHPRHLAAAAAPPAALLTDAQRKRRGKECDTANGDCLYFCLLVCSALAYALVKQQAMTALLPRGTAGNRRRKWIRTVIFQLPLDHGPPLGLFARCHLVEARHDHEHLHGSPHQKSHSKDGCGLFREGASRCCKTSWGMLLFEDIGVRVRCTCHRVQVGVRGHGVPAGAMLNLTCRPNETLPVEGRILSA